MTDELLIIFAKNPVLGKVKTRIAKQIGDSNALDIYRALLLHTWEITKDIPYDKYVFYSDFIDSSDSFDIGYTKQIQSGNDLGERMKNAFEYCFKKDYKQIVIIGSDNYELTQEMIENAFAKLYKTDIILGPAYDGGYYLLGIKKMHTMIFENKQWSTSHILNQTLKDIKSLKLNCVLMPKLNDIDTLEDIMQYPKFQNLIKENTSSHCVFRAKAQ